MTKHPSRKKPLDEFEMNARYQKYRKKKMKEHEKRKNPSREKPLDEFEMNARYQKYRKKKRKEHEKKKRMMTECVLDLELDTEDVPEDEDEVKDFTAEQIVRMRTEHMSFIAKRIQKEKEKIEGLQVTLHLLGEIKGIHKTIREGRKNSKKKREAPKDSQRVETIKDQLKVRENRVSELEQMYTDLRLEKESEKKGRKRKLRRDELVSHELVFPEPKTVYKWRQERKR